MGLEFDFCEPSYWIFLLAVLVIGFVVGWYGRGWRGFDRNI